MFALRSRTSALATHVYALRRSLATHAKLPQTYIEKVVQRHSVGLPEGKVVRAGDYVMIKPQHVMTHVRRSPGPDPPSWSTTRLTCSSFLLDFAAVQDNTGPVISKSGSSHTWCETRESDG